MNDHYGWTALHYSVSSGNYQLVKHFAETGIDINIKTNDGSNCLHIAAGSGNLYICKTLINKHNFDVQMNNHYGWNALLSSAISGSYELVKYFADTGIDINHKTNDGRNCLHVAAEYGHLILCKTLINKHKFDVKMVDNNGRTALHYSVMSGSYQLIEYLADLGTDITLESKNGKNCLHVAAEHGHLSLWEILINKHNFDVQKADNNGWTALHLSARNGIYQSIEYLVDLGTDISLETNDGRNCLHVAAEFGHLSLCETLINKHKFDVQKAYNYGCTPLHDSAKSGSYQLVKYFSNKGIDINLKINNGINCLHIAAMFGHFSLCRILLNKHNFDVHLSCNRGWTAIHYSAIKGSYQLAKYFADTGIDINLKTNDGSNCLHIAADKGHLNLCKELIYKHDFDVQLSNNDGWTALHYSVKKGSYESVQFFANMGIDIKIKLNNGNNCLHIAAEYNHLSLCKTFVDTHNFDVKMVNNNE